MPNESTPEVRQDLALSIDQVSAGAAQGMARTVAEVRLRMEAAYLYPRNRAKAFAELMEACKSPRFAVHAFYDLPRGKGISGPSVDLARQAARCWGHTDFGYTELESSEDLVCLEGWCWDLQTGARATVSDRFVPLVPRKQNGETVYVTPNTDDLRSLIAARGAKAERSAIFKILPRDFIDDAEFTARETAAKYLDGTLKMPRAERLKLLIASFASIGVNVTMIEDRIDASLENVTDAQLDDLREVYDRIAKHGERVESFFDLRAGRNADREPEPSSRAASLRRRAKDESAPRFHPGAETRDVRDERVNGEPVRREGEPS